MNDPSLRELPALEWELEQIYEKLFKPDSPTIVEMMRLYCLEGLSFEKLAERYSVNSPGQIGNRLNPYLPDEVKAKVQRVRRLRKLASRNRRLTRLLTRTRRMILSGSSREEIRNELGLTHSESRWLYKRAHPKHQWVTAEAQLLATIKRMMAEGLSSKTIRSRLKVPKDRFDLLLSKIDPEILNAWRAKIGVIGVTEPWTSLKIPPKE